MNNLECAIAVLVLHREARQWSDLVVAGDLLTQLGLLPGDTATHARPVNDPSVVTEDDVVAAETAAREAVAKATEAADKAKAARNALNAQEQQEAEAAGWAAMHARMEAEAKAAAEQAEAAARARAEADAKTAAEQAAAAAQAPEAKPATEPPT